MHCACKTSVRLPICESHHRNSNPNQLSWLDGSPRTRLRVQIICNFLTFSPGKWLLLCRRFAQRSTFTLLEKADEPLNMVSFFIPSFVIDIFAFFQSHELRVRGNPKLETTFVSCQPPQTPGAEWRCDWVVWDCSRRWAQDWRARGLASSACRAARLMSCWLSIAGSCRWAWVGHWEIVWHSYARGAPFIIELWWRGVWRRQMCTASMWMC